MKKLLFLLLFSCFSAFAQDKAPLLNFKTEKDSAYTADYEKLKTLFRAEKSTLEHKHAEALMNAYKSKWRSAYDGSAKELGRNGALGWIKENIQKTKFSSYEEAEKEYNMVTAAYIAATTTPEGKAHTAFEIKALMIYGPQIVIDVTFEESGFEKLKVKLPPVKDVVKDAYYKNRYEKLKKLTLAYYDTPSIIKARKANKEYNAKWADIQKGTNEVQLGDAGGLKWLEQNWQKTSFKSYEAAKKEFEEMMHLGVIATNDPMTLEYREYYNETMHMYGMSILTELGEDMKKNYPDKYYPY